MFSNPLGVSDDYERTAATAVVPIRCQWYENPVVHQTLTHWILAAEHKDAKYQYPGNWTPLNNPQ